MDLCLIPATDNACALAQVVAAQVEHLEQRKTKRRDKGLDKLLTAVGALLGDLLTAKLASDAVCSRVMRSDTFDDTLTSRHVAWPVLQKMERLGYLAVYPGYSWEIRPNAFRGHPSCFVVLPALVELAAAWGITPENVTLAFRPAKRSKARKVGKPVVISTLLTIAERRRGLTGAAIKLKDMGPAEVKRLKSLEGPVRAANALYARHSFDGCAIPVIYRKFQGSFDLGGRFYCGGADGFQGAKKKTTRPLIRVDGQPLAHVDIRAAHLSIACAALGHRIEGEDAYSIPGVDRDIVKLFVSATLGNGAVPGRWPPKLLRAEQRGRAGDILHVAEKVIRVYPFLEEPAEYLAGPLGMTGMGHIGTPQRLLCFRLQAIEANGLASALEELWGADIPGLPMHDGVLVPAPFAEEAERAMRRAFQDVCGLPQVFITTERY